MANDWAPEPWTLSGGTRPCIKSEGEYIQIHSPWHEDAWEDEPNEASANLHRIVACVNACAGVPTEVLESLTDSEIKEFIEEHITKEAPNAERQPPTGD